MDHVAIVNKSWNAIDKILSGKKKIESRWYKSKRAPWDRIVNGDVLYFKNSSEPVTLKAEVEKVLQFSDLTEKKIKEILDEYGGEGKICFSDTKSAEEWVLGKRYCILMFLKNVESIEPFYVSKKGFGASCAWITLDDINKIKVS